jgi:hypothetical protein
LPGSIELAFEGGKRLRHRFDLQPEFVFFDLCVLLC